MPPLARLAILLVAVVVLASAAVPPVFEDHLEPGFCSADCPMQHPGCGAVITSPPPAATCSGPAFQPAAVPAPPAESTAVPGVAGPRAPPAV